MFFPLLRYLETKVDSMKPRINKGHWNTTSNFFYDPHVNKNISNVCSLGVLVSMMSFLLLQLKKHSLKAGCRIKRKVLMNDSMMRDLGQHKLSF